MTELEKCRTGWPGIVLHPGSAVPAMLDICRSIRIVARFAHDGT